MNKKIIKFPSDFTWEHDSLADEVHVSFSLDGILHKIEHDVARCECIKEATLITPEDVK